MCVSFIVSFSLIHSFPFICLLPLSLGLLFGSGDKSESFFKELAAVYKGMREEPREKRLTQAMITISS